MSAELLRRWLNDRRGASAVQFIAVLPVFILLIVGLWSIFTVYSARDAICDATREAARYLQVEGPLLPDDLFVYPDDWEALARGIIESELLKDTHFGLTPVAQSEVNIWPDTKPIAPQDMSEILVENVPNHWFFVQTTKRITNPMGVFLPSGDPSRPTMLVSCQATAFYEGPPIGPTGGPPQPPGGGCPPVGPCTPGPGPTTCPPGDPCPTPPDCPPCRGR